MVLSVGQQVGSYRIVAEISHGKYAYVYQAVHSILTSRVVALKLLHTTPLGSSEDVASFFDEARLLEQLKHPHILSVFDANVYEGYPYTLMEFAQHGSLRDWLQRLHGRPMPLAKALTVLKEVGEALQFAHQQKVVHSDLKPENILFNAHDAALLADFDIARVLKRADAAASGVGGTPSYMAPEQFQGKVRQESDQYALGCIAYELVTGRRPFEGEDAATLRQQHLHEQPVPPMQLNTKLPQQIDWAILKALSKKYTDRYQDVASFITVLAAGESSIVTPSQEQQQSPHLILKNTSQKDDDIYYEATVAITDDTTENNPPAKTKARPKKRTSVKKTEEPAVKTTTKTTATRKQTPAAKPTPEKRAPATAKKATTKTRPEPVAKREAPKEKEESKTPVRKKPGVATTKEKTTAKKTAPPVKKPASTKPAAKKDDNIEKSATEKRPARKKTTNKS